MTLRNWAIVAAALIALGAFEPFYFKVFTVDRARMGAMLTELPYRKAPGLRTFLAAVRARTQRGDAIAIAAPYPSWKLGYEYVYTRSMYVLAGRRVLLPKDLTQASYVAAYRMNPSIPNFATVWSGPEGSLLRRVR